MREVVLVNMPFADRRRPSFALSQLAALVRRDFADQFAVRVCYLNQDVARFLGPDLYDCLAGDLEHHIAGIGDWLFRTVAFPQHVDNAEKYFARYYAGPAAAGFRTLIMRHRARLGEFCEDLADRYRLAEADIVGFSSMFAQTVPSLALARVIKERSQGVLTAMGGANCETPMGATLAANADQVDFYFSGPALKTFAEFLRCVGDGDIDRAHRIRGIVTRQNCQDPKFRSAIGADTDIDDFLEPDFTAFVDSFDKMAADCPGSPVDPILFFETSRGCWWGERAHCTFCGLNGQSLGYRSMSADNALAQFDRLLRHAHWCTRYSCTDNIMPMDYLNDVFPKLSPPPGVSIFYEVKVGLDQQDFDVMARAGVTEIQPGIEALNTGTLKLMRKGTSVFQNIQLLKNCVRYGVKPSWNLLIGFPREPESVYQKYAADLPLLAHLPPPDGCFPVRFDRYSPYFNEAADYELDLHPVDHYRLTYPFPPEDLDDLAYYFQDRSLGDYMLTAALWTRKLGPLVDRWNQQWAAGDRPQLCLHRDGAEGVVFDSRSGHVRRHRLDAPSVRLLEHLDRPARFDRLAKELPGEVDRLDRLRDLGLLLAEEERVMSVVLTDTGDDPMPRPRRRTVVGARKLLPVTGTERGPAV
jgi:ribosomal peptide maturation radical SAM protein 1